MKVIVYKITNELNGKMYIGVSNNTDNRFKVHCKSGLPIGSAIRKYGVENFEFEPMAVCGDHSTAYDLEVRFIKNLATIAPNGYNITGGGLGGLCRPHSKETKDKISKSKKGTSPWNTGKKMSEVVDDYVHPMAGGTHSKQTREKISEAGKGRLASEETKKKMSDARKGKSTWWSKGKPAWNKGKRMVDAVDGYVNHNKGKDMSDEQKQKISETLKKRSQLGAS